MSSDHLLDIIRDVYPANVQRAVNSQKAPNTAHVVPVVAELVAPEAVDIARKYITQSTIFFDARVR